MDWMWLIRALGCVKRQGAGMWQARPPVLGHRCCSSGVSGDDGAALRAGKRACWGSLLLRGAGPWLGPGFLDQGLLLTPSPSAFEGAKAGVLWGVLGSQPALPPEIVHSNCPGSLGRPSSHGAGHQGCLMPVPLRQSGAWPGSEGAQVPGEWAAGHRGPHQAQITRSSHPSHGTFMEESSGQAPGRPLTSPW